MHRACRVVAVQRGVDLEGDEVIELFEAGVRRLEVLKTTDKQSGAEEQEEEQEED